MEKKVSQRINYLDVAKGIAIIFVCMGHAISNQPDVRAIALPHLLRFISQFHMPLFFVINGMLFSDKYIEHPFKSSLHKVKVYYIPFLVYNLIFLVFHNVFAMLNLVNEYYNGGPYDAKTYLYRFIMVITCHRETFGGAMWFLGSILIISVLFIYSKYFIAKIIPQKLQEIATAIFVLICVIVGVSGKCPTAFKLNVSLYSTLFFYIGYLYKKYNVNEWVKKYKVVMFILSTALGIGIAFWSSVGVDSKDYHNFWLFTITAVLGSLMVITFSQFKFVENSKLLMMYGKKTLDIMSLHFLAFKIVSLVIVLVYNFEYSRLAEYPVVMGVNGAWWLLYVVIGATVPVFVRGIYDFVINKIKRK